MHTLDTARDTPVRNPALRSQRVVGRGAPQDLTNLRDSIIAVFGPTASGKSAVADALASRLGTEVVSTDALQVYDGLPILTNQPSTPTRLVAIRPLSSEMSVGEFESLAHDAIDDLVSTYGCAIVAGGTGLYLRAALADLGIPAAVSPESRAAAEALYEDDPQRAFAQLERLDPVAAGSIHVNDRRRVVRALELAEAGSSLAPEMDALWSSRVRYPTLVVGLEVPAHVLEQRIRARTAEMIERGAVAEAHTAMSGPISRTAAQALGLDELTTLSTPEAEEALVARTRRYAAYQRKWMRRIPGIELIDADRPLPEIIDAILDLARAR